MRRGRENWSSAAPGTHAEHRYNLSKQRAGHFARRVMEETPESNEDSREIRADRVRIGNLYATHGAVAELVRAFEFGKPYSVQNANQPDAGLSLALTYVHRHASGDWGDVCADDARANELALKDGSRVLSSYRLVTGERLWIITEADRSSTTVLLPDEY